MASRYVKHEWPITVEDRGFDTPCHIWQAAKSAGGYGQRWVRALGRVIYTHRLAYERAHGQIPAGLQIDHLCRQRACCNPDHLEAVTPATNCRRGRGMRLSDADVEAIRAAKGFVAVDVLAGKYGINRWYVYKLQQGRHRTGVA